MKLGSAIAGGMLLAAAASVPAGAQGRAAGITVYEDADYRGQNATFVDDVPSLNRYGLNRRISSVRVGPGESWEGCDEPNYRGRCQVFSNTESNLGRIGWNDRIQSLRRTGGSGGGGWWGGGGGGGGVPRDGVVLYSGSNYRGERRVITRAVSNLGSMGFNGVAQSLELGGRDWEVCRDINFRNCQVVSRSSPNLGSMSGRIASLRPAGEGGSGGGGGWRPPPSGGGEGRLELFDNRNFGGKSSALTTSSPYLGSMSGRAESLRLAGQWEICDAPEFRGRCRIVSENVPDLDRIGWKNRIQSARPR